MRAISVAVLFGCLASFPYFLNAQEISPSGGKIKLGTPGTEDKTEAVFRVEPTTLSFRYPSDLKREDPATLSNRSYRMFFKLQPDKGAEHTGSVPCSPIIFAAGITEPDQPNGDGKQKDDFAPSPPTGGITLSEIDRSCLKQRSDIDATSNLVTEIGGAVGLTSVIPGGQIVEYKLDGHIAALNVATGFSKDKQGKRSSTAGTTIIGAVSMVYQGHLYLWTFIANDVTLFNRMLKSRVQFDDQPSWPLVPFDLGSKK